MNGGTIVNSLFTATTVGGVSLSYSWQNASSSGVYESIGAGSYYLADDTHRNQGTTEINATLANDLKGRTTYAPDELTGHITVATTLSARPIRDTDAPDRGYHYDPLDWVVNAKNVSAVLTLSGGVAIGTYGSSASYGLAITGTGSLVTAGPPANLNWIVRYNTVQEQSISAWSSSTVGPSVRKGSSTATVTAEFTGWSLLAGVGEHFTDSVGGTANAFGDCQFGGGRFTIYESPTTLFNCLWERAAVAIDDSHELMEFSAFNNLMVGGSLLLTVDKQANNWVLKDNFFDRTTITRQGSGSITHDYNGYITGQNRLLPIPVPPHDVVVSSMAYAPGPMGPWYHGDTALTDKGSRTAEAAGLAGYTTRSDETPDSGDVDIGFHYPLVACNLLPLGFTINLETTMQAYLQIKPTAQTTPLPYVNVASSGRGTVARIEVPNQWNPSLPVSRVAGEYYTTPGSLNDDHGTGNPSRTTVDRYGNVWVGNRDVGAAGYGSVTKIGVVIGGIRCNWDGSANADGDYLKPDPALPGGFIYNTCIDRDRDGLIRTSPGRRSDGSLRRLDWVDEALPPGDGDEAINYYVRTTPTYVRSLVVDRDNNLWVGSKRDGWEELIDNATGAPVTGQKFLYGSGGYGAVFDPYGVLWSAGYNEASWPAFEGLLWRPPGNGVNVVSGTAGGLLPGTQYAYGIGIDPTTADVWLGDFKYGGLWQFKQSGCTNKFGFDAPDNPFGDEIKGIVVDGHGDVWVAHAKFRDDPPGEPPGDAVYRLRNTGEYLGRVVLEHPSPPPPFTSVFGKSPHGVCIDSQQRVWAICFRPAEDGKYYAMRIDPTQGVGEVVEAVDLGTFPPLDENGDYHGPYNYSDMSGFVTLAATQPAGVWDYVEDSGSADMRWLRITLSSQLNSGDLYVEVRAANSVTDLPACSFRRLDGSNGALSLQGLGIQGRYLEVRMTLLRNFGATQGPVLKSLCITRSTAGPDFQITQQPKSAVVNLGDGPTEFRVITAGSGLSYQWYKDGTAVAGGIGSTITINDAQYDNAGKYKVRVTKAGVFLDSAEARLHVVSTPGVPPNIPTHRPEVVIVGGDNMPELGDPIAFTASMDTSPSVGPLHYQWRKNGVPIPWASGPCTTSDGQNYTAGYSISAVSCQHSGEYSVVFTNQYWKVASPVDYATRLAVTDQSGNPLPLVTVTPPSPVYIENRNNPPTLAASTDCFTPLTPTCVKWYWVDQSAGIRQPIGTGMQYTLPSPVPCAWFGGYLVAEVYDEGRFPHDSAPVHLQGDCQP